LRLDQFGIPPLTNITKRNIREMVKLFNLYLRTKETYPFISQAIDILYDLDTIPERHTLYTLGLFTVIEALITHKPKPESGDSLIHQITSKIPLLDRRFFDTPLDYSPFGQNTKPDTVWRKLYNYRSHLAHGNSAKFEEGLQILKDSETVLSFLRNAAKTLIRSALHEPQLYKDLKEC
jgi:Apea-like HEPN